MLSSLSHRCWAIKQLLWVLEWVQRPNHVWQRSFHSIPAHPQALNLSFPVFYNIPWTLERAIKILHLGPWLWAVMSIPSYKCLLQQVILTKRRTALIFGHKQKYLEGSFQGHSMSTEKMKNSNFLIRTMTSSATGFRPGLLYQEWIVSCGTDFKYNQTALIYPLRKPATVIPVGKS